MPHLPSLEILYEEALRLEDVLERRGEAIDSRAGFVLGFAGVVGGVALGSGYPAVRCAAVPAVVAALLALGTLIPRPLSSVGVVRELLPEDPARTRLEMLETRLVLIAQARHVVHRKSERLRRATLMLALSVVVVGIVVIVSGVMEVLR